MISTNTYGEEELVSLLQKRNKQAFTYLYENYSNALYAIIRQIVSDRETANDVLQEVFINIWRRIESYDAVKGRLFTWMLNIARNASIDKIRSQSYKNEQKNQALPEDVTVLGAAGIKPKEDAIGLRKLLERLKEDQRKLIELSYYQGYTHEEISKGLNIPLGTVKTRIRSALAQLRLMMDE